jgi:transcriptional regulator with XRE-family HTH domain
MAGRDDDSATPPDYSRNVGQRLRAIRKQKRMSLQEVEAASSQEFKASVLGAYERGERAISVPRLQRLAGFYNVPVDQLLPHDDSAIDLRERVGTDDRAVKINLTRLEELPGAEADMLNRYLKMILVQRLDFTGRVHTVRRDAMRALACILGTGVEAAPQKLAELGLAFQA